ncbi:MAG: endolytic transglycosylase MltG [Rudaea sp.]
MTRRRLAVVAGLIALAALVAGIWLYRDFRRFTDSPLTESATMIDVAFGTSLPGIVRDLQARGIRTGLTLYWRVLARRMGVGDRLHAGEYALDVGITPRGLLAKMAAGEVIQHRFTIVEGWTFAQLRNALVHAVDLKQTLSSIGDADIMRMLDAGGTPPEGWFLPETYQFVKGMSDADILRRAHTAMQRELDRLWDARAPELPLTSKYQVLILASIVEKETARADERAKIAGVFEHRLQLGMRLQTDPSVIYGLGSAYDGKIHSRDLTTDTPYNTYTRAGLPPTPIALPGMAALEAVLHPQTTDALYFVARGDGTHEFSATLEAHNRAVEKYQLHRNR